MNQIQFYEAKLNYEIDSWDLSESLKNNNGIVVVDARSQEAFEHEYIPGAINIPHRMMSSDKIGHLDKAKLYVTYCDGIGCNASTKGALNLASLGFKVKELLGGIEWWKRDGYPVDGEASSQSAKPSCGC